MPFKHQVTDSHGITHTRTSEKRQYGFAIVRFYGEREWNGRKLEPKSECTWASRRDLAQKEMNKWIRDPYALQWGLNGAEIIECTPIATGRHA